MKRLFGGTTIEAQMRSLHSECKNVQNFPCREITDYRELMKGHS